ncbi:MAG: dephospho-CoA kinase [Polyangiaceae bacterium]|nr:dephospho-CoA kinase [Polyangiaceae bacterium]
MHLFGLTGSIGSGKSVVAARFSTHGVPVVDADVLARQAVAPGSPALARIARMFGSCMIGTDGQLLRGRLAALVFADPDARARLEKIVHPAVRALAAQRLSDLEAAGEALVCYEVPLLFEVGLDATLRPVVVVRAAERTCIERVCRRDGVGAEEARARLKAQLPLAQKASRADFVIDNDGLLAETHAQADRVLAALCRRLGVRPARYAPRA